VFVARLLKILLYASLAGAGLCAIGASEASALVWSFSGMSLMGQEKIEGKAIDSSFTVPGATTTCKEVALAMTIANGTAGAEGEVTRMPMYECTAGSDCAVKSIEAEKLPWHAATTTVGSEPYVVIEGVHIGIVYEGPLCALAGTRVIVKGKAAGRYENALAVLTFDKEAAEAAGTSLKVEKTAISWDAVMPVTAIGMHASEALELK
jgi:hypothetical protein